ncbi:MAG: dihydroorotase, partial [Candidatus Methanoperedenaceae archaeon]|nr:dihydroorotase [Candidatus Methanoperedenaceae archaeon]
KKGAIAKGYDADLIIVGEAREIRKEKLHSKAGWTPYNGMMGMFPRMAISRGDIVFEDDAIIAKRGRGRFIPGQGLVIDGERD